MFAGVESVALFVVLSGAGIFIVSLNQSRASCETLVRIESSFHTNEATDDLLDYLDGIWSRIFSTYTTSVPPASDFLAPFDW